MNERKGRGKRQRGAKNRLFWNVRSSLRDFIILRYLKQKRLFVEKKESTQTTISNIQILTRLDRENIQRKANDRLD